MEPQEILHDAFAAWLGAATRVASQSTFAPEAALDISEWASVLDGISDVAPPHVRPELWARRGGSYVFQSRRFLEDCGLLHLTRLTKSDDYSALASSLVALLAAPSPLVERWWLTDVSLEPDTSVELGGCTLKSMNMDELIGLVPIPSLYELLPSRRRIDAQFFQGSAFLCQLTEEQPSQGMRFGHMTGWSALDIWRPLLILMLWQPEVVKIEASWAIEPKRRVDELHDESTVAYYGEEAVECHGRGGYEAGDRASAAALAKFAGAIDFQVESLAQRTGKNSPSKRLRRSAEHLIRASQRSFGVGSSRDEREKDEILLNYVIAIEALLSEETEGLTRSISQRAAALFSSDEDRVLVAQAVKKAYAGRSRYAHGSESLEIELEELRKIALNIVLRWIVVQSSVDQGASVAQLLDQSLLSRTTKDRAVLDPQLEFFSKHTIPLVLTNLSSI